MAGYTLGQVRAYAAAAVKDEARRNRDMLIMLRAAALDEGKAFRALDAALTELVDRAIHE